MISLYCASKFALDGFSEALAYELASQNIIVKLVEPHGGVTSTSFSERAARGNSADASLADYDYFVARTKAAFARMTAARTTGADEVAKVIYDAATDGTDQLRYLVGDDSRGFIKTRQAMTDRDYVNFMRSWFSKEKEDRPPSP
jgi:short-subunit dehydrogenase